MTEPFIPRLPSLSACPQEALKGFAIDRPARIAGPEQAQYQEMERAFRATGGIAGSGTVAALLRKHTEDPMTKLARWIVAREVLGLDWNGQTVVPMFQFHPGTMVPRPGMREVVRELDPVLEDWRIALWFARPHAMLGNAAPVDAIAARPRAVLEAARAERQGRRG